MAFYRLISLRDDGGEVEARGAEFAADQDASDAASLSLNAHAGVEIWTGARFVGLLRRTYLIWKAMASTRNWLSCFTRRGNSPKKWMIRSWDGAYST